MPYNKSQVMWELLSHGEEYSFEIRAGKESPWDLQMKLVKRELLSGPGVASNWDEYLIQAIYQRGRAYIQYKKDKGFRIAYDPNNLLRIVPSFEIVGRYLPTPSKSKKKGIKLDQKSSGVFYYKFGTVLTADISGLAMYLFGSINSYTIGQAYAWNNQNKYTPLKVKGGKWDFDQEDFEAAGKHYNTKGGVQGAVFYHKGVGLINGLKEMKEAFPEATGKDIRALYYRFGMEPSSQISRFFPSGESTNKPRPPRKGKPRPVEGLDLIQYIGKHHIKKTRKDVTIYSNEFGQDIVVKNPFDLVQTIRSNGDNIEAGLGPKIWEEVTGQSWGSREKGDENL